VPLRPQFTEGKKGKRGIVRIHGKVGTSEPWGRVVGKVPLSIQGQGERRVEKKGLSSKRGYHELEIQEKKYLQKGKTSRLKKPVGKGDRRLTEVW